MAARVDRATARIEAHTRAPHADPAFDTVEDKLHYEHLWRRKALHGGAAAFVLVSTFVLTLPAITISAAETDLGWFSLVWAAMPAAAYSTIPWIDRRHEGMLAKIDALGWHLSGPAYEAYRILTEAPATLAMLDAPADLLQQVADLPQTARTYAAALHALRGAHETNDDTWLNSTPTHRALVQLAAEAEVLTHLVRDRHALAAIPTGPGMHAHGDGLLQSANVELLNSEIEAVRRALAASTG